MPNVQSEQRRATRYAMVLAVEVTDLAHRSRFSGRTSDLSRTGCYIDTLNPLPQDSQIQVRIFRRGETFESAAKVAYCNPGLGMGVSFASTLPEQQAILDHWLAGS